MESLTWMRKLNAHIFQLLSPVTRAISGFLLMMLLLWNIKSNKSCSGKNSVISLLHANGNFKNVSGRSGKALGPHGEEPYRDLIYLNDAYKPAIIDSQGQESFWDMEDSLNALDGWVSRG